ncbi:tellurite resistance protein TerC [Microterricola viridarii]|uniref:Tellurite resistance protein TerC n=1 Tax=Microterricola viridarii TaxID=412690 RepID=A0A1H1SNS6_9MICO|nr:tellurite resistance protein TerC [Microterricola viridarii]
MRERLSSLVLPTFASGSPFRKAPVHPDLPIAFEVGSLILLTLILVADLLIVFKRPHVPSMKEASLWVAFYVVLALIFAGLMLLFAGGEFAGQFLAGWLTEYSLSIDNLFVFVIIMARFSVPRKYQQEVLMVGIIIALVLRGVFILLGAQLIESFSWVFYIFGAFLLFTAIKQAFGKEEEGDGENGLIRWLRRRVTISDDYDGAKVRTVIDGRKVLTPMIIVFIAIGTTDLIFALDSIPAIFGITQSPFIVFTANVFALMGLRQLYFLLGGLLERLEYLKYGIAFILFFIGVKLVFHAMHTNELPFINGGEGIAWAPEIDTWTSLGVIIGSMAIATIASLIKARSDAKKRGHTLLEEVPHFTEE